MKTIFTLIITLIALNAFSTNRWDTIFVANNSVNNTIYASTSNGNMVFVGGQFTTSAGITTNYIASWDGTSWSVINNDLNGKVYALNIWDNKLVAGGEFTMAGATSLNHLGVFDGTNWNSLGTGTNGNIYAISVRDEFLYIGGSFTDIDGSATNNIAKYSTLGGWIEYATGPDDDIYAINTNNGIIAGGAFTTCDGAATAYIAHFNGTAWNALGTSVNDTVRAIEYHESVIFVGGDFTQAGTINETGCAIWDGSVWKTAGQGFDKDVYTLKKYNNILYAGGNFTLAPTKPTKRIARWENAGWNNMSGGLDNTVYTITGMERDVYIGGVFEQADLHESKYFARWGAFPLISSEPVNDELCEGENLNLEVIAESSVDLEYTWFLNGTEITDSINNTLNISSITTEWTGTYYCQVSNRFGHTNTSSFVITVNEHASINYQINDTAACYGTVVSLFVSANGTNNTYSWYHNGTIINWAVDSTINLFSLADADTGIYYCKVQNFCDTVLSNNIHLSLNSIPSATFTGLNADYCSSDEADTLTGIPTGGIFTGNGINGDLFNPYSLSGMQTITYNYTDTNGCSNTNSQITNVKYVTPISFTGLDQAYCLTSELDTLRGNPTGGTFSGDGITDSIFSPITAGAGSHVITYETVQGNGCSAYYSETTVVQDPNIYIGNDTSICLYDTLNLIITGDTGAYLWSTGETTHNINVSPSNITTYYAYITSSAGCTDTAEITVGINMLPNVIINPIQDFYCIYSSEDTITALPTGGTFTGVGLANNIFYPQSAGIGNHEIIYLYTDSNLCTSSDTVYAEVQGTSSGGGVGMVGLQDNYCFTSENDTLIGIPSGGTFTGDGMNNNIFDPSATSGPGIYYITYSFGTDSTCGSSYSQPYQILSFPELHISNDTAVCKQQSVLLNAWGDEGSYLWSTGDTTAQIEFWATTAREISVTLTTEIGCVSTDTISVTMKNAILLGLEGDTSFCRGAAYTAPQGFSYYKWEYNFIEGADITPQLSGDYVINVIDTFGCPSKDTLSVIIKHTPSINFEESYTIFRDQTIILGVSSNYNTYLWNDGQTGYQKIFSGEDLNFGENIVWLSSTTDECAMSDTTIINVLDAININDISNSIGFEIYPNPTSNYINIVTLENSKFEIIDSKSVIVYSGQLNSGTNKIDLNNYSEGLYFVKLTNNKIAKTQQFVIKH